MSDDEYDEFGNLIGGDDSDSDVSLPDPEVEERSSTAVIPHTMQPDVVVLLPEQDFHEQQAPVLQPKQARNVTVDTLDTKIVDTTYSKQYMVQTMNETPERMRTVAMVGLHNSGKTSLIDMMVIETHPSLLPGTSFKALRWSQLTTMEQSREMTLMALPVSLLLPDLEGTSYPITFIDTPGHPDFICEVDASLAVADCATLVISAVDGLTPFDKTILDRCAKLDVPVQLVINHLDRLMLDLRLPPTDAYDKLLYMVDDVNDYLASSAFPTKMQVEPNQVVFSSAQYQFMFTIKSFVRQYLADDKDTDPTQMQTMMWGEYYYNGDEISTEKALKESMPSFVAFMLLPVYKIIAHTLVNDIGEDTLAKLLWKEFGITLKKSWYKEDSKAVLREVLRQVFISSQPYVQAVVDCLKPKALPEDVAGQLVRTIPNEESALALVKLGQTVRKGDKVIVYGGSYPSNPDDYAKATINALYIGCGKYTIPVEDAPSGSVVFIQGIDKTLGKLGWFSLIKIEDGGPAFKNYTLASVYKIAIEPLDPVLLPRLTNRLQLLQKQYLALEVRVEESGEHTLYAPGELYFDCLLHDLRFGWNGNGDEVQLKVSLPMARFSETATKLLVAPLATEAKNSKLTIIAEPVDDRKFSDAIANGKFTLKDQPVKTTSKILRKDFGWDSLAARSLWCFGPSDLQFPSILLDDTLPEETDKVALYNAKQLIELGFHWTVSEGPLCDEPIRNTKFRIVDAVLASNVNGSSLIPLTRRACCAGFLAAAPRLLEPVYRVDVTFSTTGGGVAGKIIGGVTRMLRERRGEVTGTEGIPGTPFTRIYGVVPVIDSPGLETEIRLRTQGYATCWLTFESWEQVPGDPLDLGVVLEPMKPAQGDAIARDFVLKTRARKGLAGAPTLQSYVDLEVWYSLQENGLV